ncbi:MAG: hypothetical protein EOO15_15585 [Chitinophagaceae bacterium]|nr:MAG: hypothetical protein EOO15_15585 [Chitinophagaceae bacterium]
MAQVFTLSFTYKQVQYSALISVRTFGNELSVSAQVHNSELWEIAPDGELNFRLSNASRHPTAAPARGYYELEASLREAVIRHLRSQGTLQRSGDGSRAV